MLACKHNNRHHLKCYPVELHVALLKMKDSKEAQKSNEKINLTYPVVVEMIRVEDAQGIPINPLGLDFYFVSSRPQSFLLLTKALIRENKLLKILPENRY